MEDLYGTTASGRAYCAACFAEEDCDSRDIGRNGGGHERNGVLRTKDEDEDGD